VDVQRHDPAALPPGKRPDTHFIGGWVGPRAGLDGCEKSRPPPGFDPRTVQSVVSRYTDCAIPAHREGLVTGNSFLALHTPCIILPSKYSNQQIQIKCPYNKDQHDALITFSFIPINNLYMFRAGLLLIIRRYYSVYTAVGIFPGPSHPNS
jgi:hypothetical protein